MNTILAKNIALSEMIALKKDFNKNLDVKNIYGAVKESGIFDSITNQNDSSSGLEVYTITLNKKTYKMVFRVIEVVDTTKNNLLNGKQQYVGNLEKEIIKNSSEGLQVLMVYDTENRDSILESYYIHLKILSLVLPNFDVIIDTSAYKILNKTWTKMILSKEITPISEDLYSIHTEILNDSSKIYCFTTGLLRIGMRDIQAIIPRDNFNLNLMRLNKFARAIVNKDINSGYQGKIISGEPGCAYTLIETENSKLFCRDKASPNLDMKLYFSEDDIENERIFDLTDGEKLFEDNYAFISSSEFLEEHKLSLETEYLLLKNIGIYEIKVRYRKKQENESIEAEWIILSEIENENYKGHNIYDEYITFKKEDLISWKIYIEGFEITNRNFYVLKDNSFKSIRKSSNSEIETIQSNYPLPSSIIGISSNFEKENFSIEFIENALKKNYEFEVLERQYSDGLFSWKILWNMDEYIVTIKTATNLIKRIKDYFSDYNQEIEEDDLNKIYNTDDGIEILVTFSEEIIDSYRFQLKVLNTVMPDYCGVLDMSARKILNKFWVKAITEQNLIPFVDDLFNINWNLTPDNQNLICKTYGLLRCKMRDVHCYLSHEIHDKINGAVKKLARHMILDQLRSYNQNEILINDTYGSYTLVDDLNYKELCDNEQENYLTLKIYLYNKEFLNLMDNRVYNYFISIDVPYFDQKKLDFIRKLAKFSEKQFLSLLETYEHAVCININNENLWLEKIGYDGTHYNGYLMYPSKSLKLNKGEYTQLDADRIVDWLIKTDNRIISAETFYLLNTL